MEPTTYTVDVPHDLSPEEARVLGCLAEKEATVPDSYPLTLNGLRTACNQSTSRDPVVSYDDHTVEQALAALRARGLTRTVHSTSNRAAKYRHVLPDALGLDPAETAVLAVLMLRGPQTVGELKSRSDRQHAFDSIDAVADVLAQLADRGMVLQLERQPGQKDARWVHLLSPVESSGSSDAGAPGPTDHLVSVFDHGRLRIELGRRSGDGNVDLRVTVRAGRVGGQFGGTVSGTLLPSDLERFADELDTGPVGRFWLGGDRTVSVELRSDLQDGVGPELSVECTVICTEDDPQEWLQFLLFGVPAFTGATAASVRAVLAAPR